VFCFFVFDLDFGPFIQIQLWHQSIHMYCGVYIRRPVFRLPDVWFKD